MAISSLDRHVLGSTADIESAKAAILAKSNFSCVPVRFADSRSWHFEKGVLRHQSGGFFAVAGLITESNDAAWHGRSQPILDQRVPALIGLLYCELEGTIHLVLQLRAEPGNIGVVQVAPTIQSTRANYLRLHGGRRTAFIEPFIGAPPPLLQRRSNLMQSEEGSHYYLKFNEIKTLVLQRADLSDLSLGTHFVIAWDVFRPYLSSANTVNTDARSALVCTDWDLLAGRSRRPFEGPGPLHQLLASSFNAAEFEPAAVADIWRKLSLSRIELRLAQRLVPLDALTDWAVTEDRITTASKDAAFEVRQYKITAEGREVSSWDQPLVVSRGYGKVVLLGQEREGQLRFLVRFSKEIGLMGGVELGPSSVTGPGEEPVALCPIAKALACADTQLLARTRQSDEGGRFYQDENEYIVAIAPSYLDLEDMEGFWVTLRGLKTLIDNSGLTTIELRCAVSFLLPYL